MSNTDRKEIDKEFIPPKGLMSWAELIEYCESPEGKARAFEHELTFRKGFYYGVDEVIEALGKGVTARQLRAWRDNEVFDWWYHPRDRYENCLISPSPPMPWRKIRERILERDNWICRYCGGKANSVDHVIPYVKGGTDDEDNLVACCMSCNLSKGTKLVDDWEKGDRQ